MNIHNTEIQAALIALSGVITGAIITSFLNYIISKRLENEKRIKEAQKKSIESFWNYYNIWLNSFQGNWINDSVNNDTIWRVIHKEENAANNVVLTYHTMLLYIDEKKFTNIATNLYGETAKRINELTKSLKVLSCINENIPERLTQTAKIVEMNDFLIHDKQIDILIKSFITEAKKHI